MRPSKLKLEHYNLISLHVEPVLDAPSPALGTYADLSNIDFGSTVQLGTMDLPNGEARQTVELKLEAEPNADTPGFPYKLQITLVGVFDGRQLPEEKRDALVAVNGASMLYGVAREILLGLTSRAVQGAVMLPTVEFSQLAEQIKPAVVVPTDTPLKA